jgi:hypothetical protein
MAWRGAAARKRPGMAWRGAAAERAAARQGGGATFRKAAACGNDAAGPARKGSGRARARYSGSSPSPGLGPVGAGPQMQGPGPGERGRCRAEARTSARSTGGRRGKARGDSRENRCHARRPACGAPKPPPKAGRGFRAAPGGRPAPRVPRSASFRREKRPVGASRRSGRPLFLQRNGCRLRKPARRRRQARPELRTFRRDFRFPGTPCGLP